MQSSKIVPISRTVRINRKIYLESKMIMKPLTNYHLIKPKDSYSFFHIIPGHEKKKFGSTLPSDVPVTFFLVISNSLARMWKELLTVILFNLNNEWHVGAECVILILRISILTYLLCSVLLNTSRASTLTSKWNLWPSSNVVWSCTNWSRCLLTNTRINFFCDKCKDEKC